MVEREARSKVSCTSNLQHGTTSFDLVLFSTCVCALLVDDESIIYICLIHRIEQKFTLQSYSERIQERYIADRAGPMSAGLLD